MNPRDYVIGIDLGGTKIEACLLDQDRKVYERRRVPTEADWGRDRVMDNLVSLVSDVSGGIAYRIVGMGTPGTYRSSDGRLYGSPHTKVYEEPGFIEAVEDSLQVPLVVENDANCLAMAEFYATCKGTFRYVMAVILGTGVGSGLILDEKLYRGAGGGGGEFGHTSLDLDGRKCECGRRGCAEAYLSGPSLSRRYADLTGEHLDVPAIYRRYLAGEPEADRLFDESCRIMGGLFANAVNALDLEAIILGGGVSNLPIWYDRAPPVMTEALFGLPRKKLPLIKARLGDSAGVFGAAYLALRELGHMTF